MGGADAIVFTGGIGEKGSRIRAAVCEGLEELGIHFDAEANEAVKGESTFHQSGSKVQLWVIPTNEEIIVARQCVDALNQ